jgi:hypothetical protein
MSNLTTNADIINDALFRASELTDGTSDLDAQALVYYNRAYRELYMGGQAFTPQINETWWWMKAEATLILDAPISSLTVAVTNNSATATFSGTPAPTVDSDVTGWFFKVDGQSDIYKISSITAAVATLDSVYTGDTATAATCKIFKLDYDMSASAIKIIGHMTAYRDGVNYISGMALSEMDVEYPMVDAINGVPTKYAQVDENTVRFNRRGPATEGDILRIDYDYLTLPSDLADDSNEPLVPLQYRHILSDMTLFYLLADKEEQKQANVGLQAKAAITAMAQENRARWAQVGRPGQIIKRQRGVKQKLLRTSSKGLIIA